MAGLGNMKMVVMIPVMLAARKLDSEDPNHVNAVRIGYGCIQTICVLVVVYVYLKASGVTESKVVFVPPAAQPFADPNGPKKYTQIPYNAHVLTTARSLLGSTLFGTCVTCGLHYYKGMLMGLAMQIIMGPLNLYEAGIVQAALRNKLHPDHAFFEEKVSRDQLEPNAEIVDDQGQPIDAAALAAATSANAITAPNGTSKTFPELILDTWDAGAKANITAFQARLTKANVNTTAPGDNWTAPMILAGLKQPAALNALRYCVEDLGADVSVADQDGWTCLHWAAFHGNEPAALFLKEFGMALDTKDREKKTPTEIAAAEGNTTIAELLALTGKKDK